MKHSYKIFLMVFLPILYVFNLQANNGNGQEPPVSKTEIKTEKNQGFILNFNQHESTLVLKNFSNHKVVLKVYNIQGEIVGKWIEQSELTTISLLYLDEGKYYFSAISEQGEYKGGSFKIPQILNL